MGRKKLVSNEFRALSEVLGTVLQTLQGINSENHLVREKISSVRRDVGNAIRGLETATKFLDLLASGDVYMVRNDDGTFRKATQTEILKGITRMEELV